ncbi:hypothetical protein AA313_de0204897 [Arthrobotrys entomopaga]|nr:hypothetical protein AA313_de0204897 [Arthrobotrys entomopaga]
MQQNFYQWTAYQPEQPQPRTRTLAEFQAEYLARQRQRPQTPPLNLDKHPLFKDSTTPPKNYANSSSSRAGDIDAPSMQPTTPPPRSRPDYYNVNQSSPSSPQTPRTQFTSKSAVPNRWMPEYPPASTKTSRSKLEIQAQREREAREVIERGIESSSSSDEDYDEEDDRLSKVRRDITSLSDNYSARRFDDESENVENSPPEFARFIRPRTPAQEAVVTYDEYGNEVQLSPGTLYRQLQDAKDIMAAEKELRKLKLEPNYAAVVKPVARQIFPTFPTKFQSVGEVPKPFIPDDYLVPNMADIPNLLANYKPHYVHALFGNYIVSCDDIDELYSPMRVGQLSIFIPIDMKSEETIIVGLAPCELFHSSWTGTGCPAPAPDRSIIGKRAYEVQVALPLQRDFTIDRRHVRPTGNTLGTVIGVAGAACVLRIEKWFLHSFVFATESRIIPVWGGKVPKNPRLVFYDSPKVYNEHRRELERKATDRREMERKISIASLGGTPDRDPGERKQSFEEYNDPNYLNHGPIAPPQHLSPVKLHGVSEPRVEPVRVPWGKMHGMSERDQRKEKINLKMEEIAKMIKTLQK